MLWQKAKFLSKMMAALLMREIRIGQKANKINDPIVH